jgi:cytochrome c
MRHVAIVIFAVLGLTQAAEARAADADAGARVFKTQCGTCHAVVAGRNLVGPSLFGVVGRKAGDLPGFRYSAANKGADFVWDEARLDPYLANPKAVIPGTSMLYAGLKNDEQRADVIAYLATLK